MDFEQWAKHVLDIPGQQGQVCCYLPDNDTQFLSIATSLWRGDVTDWEEMRSHKWGGRVIRGRIHPFDHDLVFKRFTIRNLRFLHKTYRARGTIRQEQAVSQAGFNTARIRCLIERRRFGVVVESALLFDAFEDTVPVYHLLNRPELGVNSSREKRRALLRALGEEVGRWHGSGFYHGDLHTGNIFVREVDGQFHFYWIDNEEGQVFARLPDRKRIADLDHINRLDYNLTLMDRWRFWESYCEASGLDAPHRRVIAMEVLRRSGKFRRKRGLD